MPISPEHAGRSYPATEPYQVSRAKIAEFAAALRDENPAYRVTAGDSGAVPAGTEPIAPPTFAAVIAFRAWDAMFADPELGLALHRTIHTEQGFTWARPLRAGDEVTATLTIDKVRTRGGSDMIQSSIRLQSVAGEHICTATGTFLHAHPTPATSGEDHV